MEKRKIPIILLFLLFLIGLISVNLVNACGCGIAISDIKVFNSLKETQAYMIIDVLDENTYNEMPFFRFVSMNEPYEVTIVFPIDQIPYDVEGEQLTAQEFLDKYKVNIVEDYFKKQDFSEVKNKLKQSIDKSNGVVFAFSNGIIGLGGALGFIRRKFGAIEAAPIARFEFEGGRLEIYNISSMETLEEFVKTINITLTGKVKELVTKYNNYYVAVLYLKIPSALDEVSREKLKLCPDQAEMVKKTLEEKTEFTVFELRELTQGPCEEELRKLVDAVTDRNSNVNGTLVIMKFEDAKEFFYPTSIVNSYKYPVTEQKYFIKTPSKLHANLVSSEVAKIASFNGERWYKIESTKEDIKGEIVKASVSVKFGDFKRKINSLLYGGSGLITFLIYAVIIILPLMYYSKKVDEKLNKKEKGLSIGMFVLGGFLLSSIVMLFKKKWKLSLTLFIIWLLLLILFLGF